MAKKYNKQFKQDALQYREDNPQLSVIDVCRKLGISAPTFYNWQKQARENDGEVQHVGSGNYASDLEKENARLKRELKAQEDTSILLKTMYQNKRAICIIAFYTKLRT